MATYNLKYFAEIHNFRGLLARVEILQRSNSAFSVLEIGDVCGLVLEIQGGQEDVFTPIVKTQARLSMVSCDDKPTAGGVKYGGWGEFYTPDATLYKMCIKTKPSASAASWTTRWTGYITPDSWQEGLEYRGAITITARDNIGHLQDFEFDMQASAADAYGLVSIRNVLAAAMAKIEMPMSYVDTSAPAAISADGTDVLDAMVAMSMLQGHDWLSVVEGLLDSIGYTLRYTDSNRVTVAPLRYLPLLGETSEANQPSMDELEFFGGVGEMVPAVKQITETHDYDYNAAVGVAIFGEMTFGSNETYRCKVDGNTLPSGGHVTVAEHDAPMNKVTAPGSTAWRTGSDMLNPARITGVYWSNADDETLYSQYVLLAANGVDGSKRTQSLEFLCDSSDVCIEAVFAENPISLKESSGGLLAVHTGDTLAAIVYELSYTKGGVTRYWDGRGWQNTASDVKVEYDSQNESATDLKVTLEPSELGRGGVLRFTFKDIQYKCFYNSASYCKGIYARLSSFQVSVNKDNLVRNTVRTVNDEKYNVLLSRDPDFAPLSRDVSMVMPQNYPSALYYYPAGSSFPTQYPYQGNWDNLNTSVVKPLPVLVHQQILCYRGASLWELSGECAPKDGGLFRFNALTTYKSRTYILMSGTLDFRTGSVVGAILREFLEYDDVWDDTEQGDWTDEATYIRDGSSPVTSYGGGGGASSGGGGTSLLKVWKSLTNNPDLESNDDTTPIAVEHLSALFTVETLSGGGKYLKLNTQFAGLAADGFVTAGGVGSGGGGGGGVDLDRVWQSLTNNTDKPDVKINAAHIPVASVNAIGGVKVDGTTIVIQNGVISAVAQGTGSVNSLTVGSENYTPDANGKITIPAYPTALASPYALTFGNKTYDGSAAKTITAADLGALTSVAFGDLTGHPTTLSGYGITDAKFGSAGADYVPITLGGTTKNVLTEHQSLAGYATRAWVSQQGFLTTETDPTVPSWAKQTNKPSYALSEITGTEDLQAIEGLSGTSGLLKKTAANTWTLDTTSYLPIAGGTITGDLRLKDSSNYGKRIRFGDGDYAYIHEDSDDHLTIFADKGISLNVGSGYVTVDGNPVLTSHQTIYALTLQAGTFSAGTYTPNSAAKTVNIPTTLDHISDGSQRKLADYLPLSGGTMTGAITMSGANILTATDSTNSIGASGTRFLAGHIRNIYTTYFAFMSDDGQTQRGNFGIGNGYAEIAITGSQYNYMFNATYGFFHGGDGDVPCGRSDHRWSNVYAVGMDLSGDLALGSASHIDIGPLRLLYDSTNKALRVTKVGSSDTNSYGLYADGFVSAGGVGGPSSHYVRYVSCTQSEYNALQTKDDSTLYAIGSPVSRIYIGSNLVFSEN